MNENLMFACNENNKSILIFLKMIVIEAYLMVRSDVINLKQKQKKNFQMSLE